MRETRSPLRSLPLCLAIVATLTAAGLGAGPVERLPSHLAQSGIPTEPEIALVGSWVEHITSHRPESQADDRWVEGWLAAGLPFSFRYDDKPCNPSVASWKLQQGGPTRQGPLEQRSLIWTDPGTGLQLAWHLKRLLGYPAVEWVITLENVGSEDTPLVEDWQALALDMNVHSGEGHTVHGAHGGRSKPDDLIPFGVPVPEAEARPGPGLELLRQDYEELEVNQSILRTPLAIGGREFERGIGTHSVSRIRIHSPTPIARFSAYVGVDLNERTRGGRGSIVFSAGTKRGPLFKSDVMHGGQEPARVDVETGGVHRLELNVDDAGDGPACDHADWADAQLRLADGTTLWLDELPQTAGAQVRLGSRRYSSNHHLPFFNIEGSEARGVLVGLGWTGNWDAEVSRQGTRLSARAGLPTTRFFLRPGEKVRSPRVLLVFWQGERLHGHNMLRQVLYRHYMPKLHGEPPKPLVSVNVCFTHHGKGGYLTQATEETVVPLVKPFVELGAEAFVIDAGWYPCKAWPDIMETGDFSISKQRYARGFRPVSDPLARAGVAFGLWFPPEALGFYHEKATREEFLAHVDTYAAEQGLTMYRQDLGRLPPDAGPDRAGVAEMLHVAGLYAMQDELRRRHPDFVMEGCCGGGRRIDLETISRFHWHQKSDRWYDSVSDQCGLYGANLFLPGGVLNIPTERTDDYGAWSSFGGQFCLGWHPLDEDFPMQQAKQQVDRYKRIRPMLRGDFYPLTECSLNAPWLAYQFHHHDLDRGFVLVFKRTGDGGDVFKLAPRGLIPTTTYSVTFESSGKTTAHTGVELANGVELVVSGSPDAELAVYGRAE